MKKKLFLFAIVLFSSCAHAMDNPLFERWVDQDERLAQYSSVRNTVVLTVKFSDAAKTSAILLVPFVAKLSGDLVYNSSSSLPMGVIGGVGGGMLYSAFLGGMLFPKESKELIMDLYKSSRFSYESRVKKM